MFSKGSMIKNWKIENISDGIMQVHKLYLQRGFKITHMHADCEFEQLSKEVTTLGIYHKKQCEPFRYVYLFSVTSSSGMVQALCTDCPPRTDSLYSSSSSSSSYWWVGEANSVGSSPVYDLLWSARGDNNFSLLPVDFILLSARGNTKLSISIYYILA